MTNAEYIRSLSDEELAAYIEDNACTADWCHATGPCELEAGCRACILAWLREEVESK